MIKKLASAIIAFMCLTAFTQAPVWTITKVVGKDKTIAGYIYYTNGVGTEIGSKTTKVFSSLRLVCSTTASAAAPLIVLFWDGMHGISQPSTSITINGKSVMYTWSQEDNILIRDSADSIQLMKSLKNTHQVKIEWVGDDAIKRKVIMDVSGINAQINDFNTVCKSHI